MTTGSGSFMTRIYDGSLEGPSNYSLPKIDCSFDFKRFLEALKANPTVDPDSNRRKQVPFTPGVPAKFYNNVLLQIPTEYSDVDKSNCVQLTPSSWPSLAEVLNDAKSKQTIQLEPGVYEGPFNITQDCSIIADGEVIIDGPIIISTAEVTMEGLRIREGAVDINSGILHMKFCTFSSLLAISGCSKVDIRKSKFQHTGDFSIRITENSTVELSDSDVLNSGILVEDGSYASIINVIVENTKGVGVDVRRAKIDLYNVDINQCGDDCLRSSRKSEVSLNNCRLSESEGNLVAATHGANVRLIQCDLTGKCDCAVLSAMLASVLLEDLSLWGPVHSTSSALVMLRGCTIPALTSNGGRLIIHNSHIVSSRTAGVYGYNGADIQIFNSEVIKCEQHGLELTEDSTATIVSSSFKENNNGGALVSALSATFKQCTFSGNGVVGCEITGLDAGPTFEECRFEDNEIAGLHIREQSVPLFTGCHIEQNHKYGIVVSKATPTFKMCVITENKELGIDLSNAAHGVFEGTALTSNDGFAVQCRGKETTGMFVDCQFTKQKKTGAVYAIQSAICDFNRCTFSENQGTHIEILDQAKCHSAGCVYQLAKSNSSVFVHANGVFEDEESTLGDGTTSAVYVGSRGIAGFNRSKIQDCTMMGVVIDSLGNATFKGCEFLHNGGSGIYVEAQGVASVESCLFAENTDYGIFAPTSGTVTLEQNTFENNKRGDKLIN